MSEKTDKETTADGPSLSNALEILEVVKGLEIEFFEQSVVRNNDEPADQDTSIEATPDFTLKVGKRDDSLSVRLKIEFDTAVGRIVADAVAYYDLGQPYDIPQPVALEFANKVGVMALLPYLREAVHGMTTRVFGAGLLLPIIRNGELAFTESEIAPPPDGVSVD